MGIQVECEWGFRFPEVFYLVLIIDHRLSVVKMEGWALLWNTQLQMVSVQSP